MDRAQLEADLALQGWEVWKEDLVHPPRYNFTHPDHGTVWAWGDSCNIDDSHHYRYGLNMEAVEIQFSDVPELAFRQLNAWVRRRE